MTSLNRTHPNFWAHLFSVMDGAGLFEGCTFKAMILDDTTTADTEWDSQTTVADFSTLGELSSGSRIAITGLTYPIPGASTQAFLNFTAPVWSALAAGTNPPQHVLFYVELAGWASDVDSIPVALVDAVFTPDGTDFTCTIPINGLLGSESAP